MAPGALPQYVHRGALTGLLPAELARKLPGPSDEPPMHRAQRIYEVLAQHGISTVHEPTSSQTGRQAIRTPDEVLTGPRQATCLDIAITFCGACLDAALHPLIVALDSPHGGPGHALVLVWLDGSWGGTPAPDYPWRAVVHDTPPKAELIGQLRAAADQPGSFLALDVAGATRTPGAEATPWAVAIARGAELVNSALTDDGAWRWGTAVDIGLGWQARDVHPLPHRPQADLIVPAYLEPDPDGGPLMQLRARRGVVPFYGRDELDVLLEWCQAPDVAQRTRMAVVHGVGGAGKTHLAAELAYQLSGEGWYAGFLAKHAAPEDLGWLAGVVSPLLIVIDYPEDVRVDVVISLLTALRGREEPACVILTARTLGSWWSKDIIKALQREGIPYTALPSLGLPPRHPSSTGVFRRALRAFSTLPGMSPVEAPPPDPRWTTLDLVMLAWLAAQGAAELPTSPEQLYDEILDGEFDYWGRVCLRRGMKEPPQELLPTVGGAVTLLAPTPKRVAETLLAVKAFEGENKWRHEIAAVIKIVLPPDSETGTVTLRPDPVGERLVLQTLGSDQEFLGRCLKGANDEEQLNACLTITRAAERDEPGAAALAAAVLDHRPQLWRAALAVFAAHGGPFGAPLLALADRDDSPLPLEQLAESIPLGHVTLRNLALIATQRTRPPDPADPGDPDARARLAGWWNNLSNRQSETGDRTGALESITEAVGHYRELAAANPAAFLPNLARSLNNLASWYAEAGKPQRALNAFATAWVDLPPGPRAELAVTRSQWRASQDDLTGAVHDLHTAAGWAQQETEPRRAGRSRRAVRDTVAALLAPDDTATVLRLGLPEWAWRPLPEDLTETLNHWLGAAGWGEREFLLRTHPDLSCESGRAAVHLAGALYPEVEPLTQLADILDDIAARSLEQVLAEFRATQEHAELLQRWLTTTTWSQSRDFLQAHPGLASDPHTLAMLQAGIEDPLLAQHLGITRLAIRMPIAEVYDAVTDREMAVDTAMGCVERGDSAMLGDLFLAAPHLRQLPFVTPFLTAVHAVLDNAGQHDSDTATAVDITALMRTAATQGSDTQRGAGAARLRRLARRLPSHADTLHALADILTASDQPEPAPGSAVNALDTPSTTP